MSGLKPKEFEQTDIAHSLYEAIQYYENVRPNEHMTVSLGVIIEILQKVKVMDKELKSVQDELILTKGKVTKLEKANKKAK